jgi:hypothetical protein
MAEKDAAAPVQAVNQEELQGQITETVNIPVATWQALATGTPEVEVLSLPAKGEVLSCSIELVTEFAGGSVSAATASVGPNGSETTMQTAQNVFTGAGTGLKLAVGTDYTTNRAIFSTSTATSIVCQVALTSDTSDNLTTGEVNIYLSYVVYS